MPRRPSTHVDSPAAVGQRLRAARLAAGLSQRELSFDGCTAAYVSRIEAGARTPSYQILREFAKRLGVTADYLATGDDGVLADPLVEAEIALRLGELDRAAEIYAQWLREAGDEGAAARAEAGLGRVALARGDVDEAIERLSRARSGAALPAPESADAAEALGRAYCLQGQFDEASAVLEHCLERAQERGDRLETARFGLLLAAAYAESGSSTLAEDALAPGLGDAPTILDPLRRAELYWSQSHRLRSGGNADLAAGYAQLASATLRSAEHATAAARAMLLQARMENDRGDGAAALALLDDVHGALAEPRDGLDRAAESIQRARAFALLGRHEEARSLMEDVVSGLDDPRPDTAAAYAAAASFFRSQGDSSRALELYGLAVDRAPASSRYAADALTAMAQIHEERGEADEALRFLKAALAARDGVVAV